jgi:hypothetical protein
LEILGLTKIEGISLHQPQRVQVRPVNGDLQILFDDVPQAPVAVKVYNLSGLCVYSESMRLSGTEITIDLPLLPQAVYAVQIETQDKNIQGSCLIRL